MKVLTKEQQQSLKRIYYRDTDEYNSYLSFRRQVQHLIHDDCIMIPWKGMWIGIETDGYDHT